MQSARAVITRVVVPTWLGFCFLGCAGSSSGQGTNVFNGRGICRFSLEDYALSPATEGVLNRGVSGLDEIYRIWLGFSLPTNPVVRIRIFGKKEDFESYRKAKSPKLGQSVGFYSPSLDEVAVLKQDNLVSLAKVTFHEASHCLLEKYFADPPVWLNEGLADYMSDVQIRRGWPDVSYGQAWLRECQGWLQNGVLPELNSVLKTTYNEFHEWDEHKLYTTCWSLVSFLNKTAAANNQTLKKLILHLRRGRYPPTEVVRAFNGLYPGGLKKLEADWRAWIAKS